MRTQNHIQQTQSVFKSVKKTPNERVWNSQKKTGGKTRRERGKSEIQNLRIQCKCLYIDFASYIRTQYLCILSLQKNSEEVEKDTNKLGINAKNVKKTDEKKTKREIDSECSIAIYSCIWPIHSLSCTIQNTQYRL